MSQWQTAVFQLPQSNHFTLFDTLLWPWQIFLAPTCYEMIMKKQHSDGNRLRMNGKISIMSRRALS